MQYIVLFDLISHGDFMLTNVYYLNYSTLDDQGFQLILLECFHHAASGVLAALILFCQQHFGVN